MCWITAFTCLPKSSPARKNKCWHRGSLSSNAPVSHIQRKEHVEWEKLLEKYKMFHCGHDIWETTVTISWRSTSASKGPRNWWRINRSLRHYHWWRAYRTTCVLRKLKIHNQFPVIKRFDKLISSETTLASLQCYGILFTNRTLIDCNFIAKIFHELSVFKALNSIKNKLIIHELNIQTITLTTLKKPLFC